MLEQTALRIGLLVFPPAGEQMVELLDEVLRPGENVIWGHDDMEPLAWLKDSKPDVLLLDAAHGGMELADELQREGDLLPVILLADNYEQVLDGYRLSVKRCLMKPPEREKLEEALRFCRSAYGRKSFRAPLANGERRVIRFGEILWFRGYGHKILLYVEGSDGPLELGITIPELEYILPASFVRCHHSTTVNVDKIRSLERAAAILTDGSRIPVSRRKYELVRSRYMASTRLCMQERRVL